jgi:thiol:disulfide interchange protein
MPQKSPSLNEPLGAPITFALTITFALALALMACERSSPERAQEGQAPAAAASAVTAPPAYGPLASIAAKETAAKAGESWNAGAIDWQPYEAGMKRAKAENKPVCLIFYANWCPHCRNYSHVFEDPRIVERARGFVMIRINSDDDDDLSRRYSRDGGYVPRTFFLAPDGKVLSDIHAPRPQYVYFYDEHDPASLLAGMETASRSVVR